LAVTTVPHLAILDRNGHQSGGAVDDIMPLGDMAEKWRAMGWNGHWKISAAKG
jgi:transketolase N-terminal domain/subunit